MLPRSTPPRYTRASALTDFLATLALILLLAFGVVKVWPYIADHGRISSALNQDSLLRKSQSDQLRAEWRFDECGGAVAQDDEDAGGTGTLSGAPTWSTDTPLGTGCSIQFNGQNTSVDANSRTAVPSGNKARSVFAWIKTTAQSGCIVSMGNQLYRRAFNLVYGYTTPGVLGLGADSDDVYPTSGATLSDGKWHFVGVVYDGVNVLKFYVDGQLDNTASPPVTYDTDGSSVRIGGSYQPGAEHWFNGDIDDVRIYDIAVTADAAHALFAQTAPTHAVAAK